MHPISSFQGRFCRNSKYMAISMRYLLARFSLVLGVALPSQLSVDSIVQGCQIWIPANVRNPIICSPGRISMGIQISPCIAKIDPARAGTTTRRSEW